MTAAEYPPGTLAKATVRGVPDVVGFTDQNGGFISGQQLAHTRFHTRSYVTDVRRLVVLDPKRDGFAPHLLVANLREKTGYYKLADQIEAQTAPPRPPEPQGFGARVKDSAGVIWLRTHGTDPWLNDYRARAVWDELISPVEVLFEGEQP